MGPTKRRLSISVFSKSYSRRFVADREIATPRRWEELLHHMKVSDNKIEFSETDFKEVFALVASETAYELRQIDEPTLQGFARDR